MQAGGLWTHGQNQNHCGNYSSCHHKIIWEPTDLWHSIPHSLLSYAGLLWRQSSFLVLWENSKCKSNPSCPEHRALLSAKLLLMWACWATTGLCGDGFMGGQMPKETFISVGWKEQQKCPKSREDQTGAKVLIHCFSSFFLPPFLVELLEKRDLRKRTFSFLPTTNKRVCWIMKYLCIKWS